MSIAYCLPILTFFFSNDTATTEIYTLSLHDALPICAQSRSRSMGSCAVQDRRRKSTPRVSPSSTLAHCAKRHAREAFRTDRKSTRLNSSHSQISYAVFCLKKKNKKKKNTPNINT